MEEGKFTRRGLAVAGLAAFLGGIVGAAVGRVGTPPVERTVTELKTVTSPVVTTQTLYQTITSPVLVKETVTVTAQPGAIALALPERPFPIPKTFRFDLKYVAERAYSGYKAVCCSFGAVDAILGTLIDNLSGQPWESLPGRGAYDPTKPIGADRYVALYDKDRRDFFGFTGYGVYGCGGIVGFGLTCGLLLGIASAVPFLATRAMATKISEQIIWAFENEAPLPSQDDADYIAKVEGLVEGKDYVLIDEPLHTTMCHATVAQITKRLVAKGITDPTPLGKARSNTCGLLTVWGAVRAAKLLNEYLEKGDITATYSRPREAEICLRCHGLAGPSSLRIHFAMKDYCKVCHKENWKHP